MSVTSFRDLLDDLLAAAEVAITEPRTTRGVPDCSRVSHDTPVWDFGECSILTTSGRIGLENLTGAKCAIRPVAFLTVTLLRCVTSMGKGTDGYPGCDLLDSEARDLAQDGWALWSGLTSADPLFPGYGCETVRWGEMIPLKPNGNMAGWRLTLNVNIQDPPDAS